MKLLYITFIDLDSLPETGSSVRPLQMKVAFEQLGAEVVNLTGMNNDIKCRRKAVKELKKKLITWKPDLCYIEPPTGPFFYYGDVRLLKKLHKLGVPMSIFYRDAYWRYPEYYLTEDASIIDKHKHKIIRFMQKHQWKVFCKNMDVIYFPSKTMADQFDCKQKKLLPPGSFVSKAKSKEQLSDPLQFIFVGGAHKNHGTFLTLDSFERVNRDGVRAKLTYICPETAWRSLGIDEKKYEDWLSVVHTSGENNLLPFYEKADIAILTAPRTFYRDFAVPIKIYEYISYQKPILVTDCTETARVVNDNHVGWVTEADVSSICEKIEYLCDNRLEIESIRANMLNARDNNLWLKRAEQVISDLTNTKT